MRRIYAYMLALFLLGNVPIAGAEEVREAYLAGVRAQLMGSPLDAIGRRAQRLTLEECVELALAHNGKLTAAEEAIHAAQAQRTEADARFWPVFDYEYRTAPVPQDVSNAAESFFRGEISWFHSLSMTVGMPIYAFGKLTTLQHLADRGIRAAHQQRRKEAAQVVAEVRKLYYGIQLAEELGDVAKEAIDRLNAQIDLDPAESKKRKVSPIDRLKMQLTRAEIEKRLSEARTKERVALEALRVQLGFPFDSPVAITKRTLDPVSRRLDSVEHYVQEALAVRPDALLVDIGVDAKRLEYQLESRKRYPDLGVGAVLEVGRTIGGDIRGITSTDDFNHPFDFTRAGLGLQVKGRFDWHGSAARVRKKRHEYFEASLKRDLAKEGIGLDVRKAWLEARAAKEHVERSTESEELARRMFFLTKSNNELGIGDSDDYTEAIKYVLMTRAQLYEAMFQLNSAVIDLDEKIGVISYASVWE